MSELAEIKAVLPLVDNGGNAIPSIHAHLEGALCARFGGATIVDGSGLWQPDGQPTKREPVRVYTVAIDPEDSSDFSFAEIMHAHAYAAKQESIYLVHPSLGPQIETVKPVCMSPSLNLAMLADEKRQQLENLSDAGLTYLAQARERSPGSDPFGLAITPRAREAIEQAGRATETVRNFEGLHKPLPAMPGQVVWRDDTGYPVRLSTRKGKSADRFAVSYGLQLHDRLDYAQACAELGKAIMHALACESKISNE